MAQFPVSTSNEHAIYAALELSKNSWLLAIQLPDRDNPSLHPIKGGDAEGLVAKLDAARQRLAKASGQVPKLTLCATRQATTASGWRASSSCGALTVGSWTRPACRSIGAPVG